MNRPRLVTLLLVYAGLARTDAALVAMHYASLRTHSGSTNGGVV